MAFTCTTSSMLVGVENIVSVERKVIIQSSFIDK